MNDKRDIVERLRHDADGLRTVFIENEFDDTIRLEFEAADEIDRLRGIIADMFPGERTIGG